MKVNELQQSLKQQQIAPLYLVVGSESELMQQVRQIFVQYLTPEEQELNVAEFDLEQVDVQEAVGEANTLPFLGEHRLVLVTNPIFLSGTKNKTGLAQNVDSLMEYVQDPQPTTIFVILAPYEKLDQRKKITKVLKQKAQVVDVQKLTTQSLQSSLQKQITSQGFTIVPAALTALIQRTKGDYSLANSELRKLFLYAQKQKVIDLAMVQQLVPQSLDDNVFDLLDAILQHNLRQAESLYQQLLILNNDPILLTALAQSQIRVLLQVKILAGQGMSQGKLAQFLQIHPYRVKLALQRIKNYDLGQLKKALSDLIEMDYQMKTGQADKTQLFELFMIAFITNKKTG